MKPVHHELAPHNQGTPVKPLDGKHRVASVEKGSLGNRHPTERRSGHTEVLDLGEVAQMACLEDVRTRREANGTQPSGADGRSGHVRQSRLGLGAGKGEARRDVLPRGLRVAQEHLPQLALVKRDISISALPWQTGRITDEDVAGALPPAGNKDAQPVLLGKPELGGKGGPGLPLSEKALEIGSDLDGAKLPLPQGKRERERLGISPSEVAKIIRESVAQLSKDAHKNRRPLLQPVDGIA